MPSTAAPWCCTARALPQCLCAAPVSVSGTVARTPRVGACIKALRPCAHARHARTCLTLVQNIC
eukprot:4928614-Alexandrium_andersonii.AAC.1